jgi:tetratricopeptide (TPR) repeat protein
MAKCWTCGTHVSGYHYTCSSCKNLTEIKSLQERVRSHDRGVIERLDYIEQVQQESFNALANNISEGLTLVASAIEWGFGELSWQLQQQTAILQSINHTLNTPSETKANEWRLHAEELRRRGVLDESEEFFLKALDAYRLDYRIYVGLAETYLQLKKFDKAKFFLEKSLPHAPKQEIDYKSYSYRLIGRIYACEEDYSHATSILQTAIDLSPNYTDGHYDYAQYCAQIGNASNCLSSLQKAVLSKPLYLYLARIEQNFDPSRNEVRNLLNRIKSDALCKVQGIIKDSEKALKEANETISEARNALILSKDEDTLNSSTIYRDADMKLKLAKEKVAKDDYNAFLEAIPIVKESYSKGWEANRKAYKEQEYYNERHAEKVRNQTIHDTGAVIGGLIGLPIGFLIGVISCFPGMIVLLPVALIWGDSAAGNVILVWVCICSIGCCVYGVFGGANFFLDLFKKK